jgi:hypothetical protein
MGADKGDSPCRGDMLLERSRQVTSDWHLSQARELIAFDAGRELDTVLVYAALEVRAAIERELLELLVLCRGKNELTDDELRRAKSQQGLEALLKEADANYRVTVEFTKIAMSNDPHAPKISPIDTKFLRKSWQALSSYCHFQAKPAQAWESPNREFQKKGYSIIQQVLNRFDEWRKTGSRGVIQVSTMPQESRYIYDRFVSGKITASETRRLLDMVAPILDTRR